MQSIPLTTADKQTQTQMSGGGAGGNSKTAKENDPI